jgi:hypothetical protein
VPSVFFRPPDRADESDAAREKFMVPESDHLTCLHVFQQWKVRTHARTRSLAPALAGLAAANIAPRRVSPRTEQQLLGRVVQGPLHPRQGDEESPRDPRAARRHHEDAADGQPRADARSPPRLTRAAAQPIHSCGTEWDVVRKAICSAFFHQAARLKGYAVAAAVSRPSTQPPRVCVCVWRQRGPVPQHAHWHAVPSAPHQLADGSGLHARLHHLPRAGSCAVCTVTCCLERPPARAGRGAEGLHAGASRLCAAGLLLVLPCTEGSPSLARAQIMTTKEYMRTVTAVEPQWLAEVGPMFFSIKEDYATRAARKRRAKEEVPRHRRATRACWCDAAAAVLSNATWRWTWRRRRPK